MLAPCLACFAEAWLKHHEDELNLKIKTMWTIFLLSRQRSPETLSVFHYAMLLTETRHKV